MSHLFSLIGDSNVRQHVNKNSCRASKFVKSSQVLICNHLEGLVPSLEKVRPESTICLLSCASNFITGSEDLSLPVAHRVEPVLHEMREALHSICSSNPARRYMIAPPMYRTTPLWYREGLPEILNSFSQVMNSEKPENMHLLPSFPTPDFAPDGIHLTPYAGLEFILHLFDSAQGVLEALASAPEHKTVQNRELTRVLEDRVVALEQDHRRLNRVVDDKIALDAEYSDYLKNERFQDCFVVEGVPKIPDEIVGKPWQDQAVKDVQKVIKLLMGREMNIVFIQNATTRQADAVIAYSVKMTTISDSKAIRDKFGSYFIGNVDRRPENLKPYSIKNRITAETKIRISILKLIAKRYRDSNPGSKVQVVGYEPRPLIKITPPASASNRRVQAYNYCEAVKTLPTNFSAAEIGPIVRRINPKLQGQIKSLFIIISDDQVRPRDSKPPPSQTPASASNSATAPTPPAIQPDMESSSSSQPDNEDEGEPEPLMTLVSGRRSQKRSASGSKGGPAAKK